MVGRVDIYFSTTVDYYVMIILRERIVLFIDWDQCETYDT